MTRRPACLLVLLLVTAACQVPTPGRPTADPYPTNPTSTYARHPRPKDIDLTGRNPCHAIPKSDYGRLDLSDRSREYSDDKYGVGVCLVIGVSGVVDQ